MSPALTVRLDPDLDRRLERLAEAMHRPKSLLVAEAIRSFVDRNEWQVQEIERAVIEAENGDFASEDLVLKVFRRWGVDSAQSG